MRAKVGSNISRVLYFFFDGNKAILTHGFIKKTEKTVRPKPPFTTSKLQQAAANKLGFTSRKTMQIAQQLYEGIQIGENHVGLITYMRTDSVRISETALADVREWLSKNHLPNKIIS